MPSKIATTARVSIRGQSSSQKGSRFRMVAYTGEPLHLEGWTMPVVIDMKSIAQAEQRIPILYNHAPEIDHVIGQSETIKVINGQVIIEGPIFDTPTARRIKALAQQGFSWQASVGGEPAELREIMAGETETVNGREYSGPAYIASGTQIKETSFVVIGADNKTSAVLARKGELMDFDKFVASLGFDAKTLNDTQRTNLTQLFEARQITAEGDPEEEEEEEITAEDDMEEEEEEIVEAMDVIPEDEEEEEEEEEEEAVVARGAAMKIRSSAAREATRVAAIIKATRKNPAKTIEIGGKKVNLRAHAIRAGWSATKTQLVMMRASRATAGEYLGTASRNAQNSLQALQGGLLLRCGGRLDHECYAGLGGVALKLPSWMRRPINDAERNRIMEASHHMSQMSAVDLCREAVRLDGKTPPRDRHLLIQAAVSGGSLSNIFTTNVNAQLLATFLEAPDTTDVWTQRVDVADFKLQERPRLTKGGSLAKLPRGGTADHTSRSDVVETYRIFRYALQFSVDDQDLIDDNLGALQDVPVEMGNAAARLVPDLVYAVLLSNPTLNQTSRALFNATDGNLITSSALASATLKTGISTMQLFTENGVNVGQPPTHILVPPTLRFTAQELLQSTTIVVAGTAGSVTERGSANTLEGLVTPIADPRLENGVVDPNSGTTYSGSSSTWYLVGNQFPTIEVAYLRGTGRAPQVRNFQLDRGQFGMGWDIKFDVGAKAMGWRGLLKATA